MQSVVLDDSPQHGQTSPLEGSPSTTSVLDSSSPQNDENPGSSIIEEDTLKVVNDVAEKIVAYCKENNVEDPVEILRYFQKVMVEGRALRIQDSGRTEEGDTNFIMVDRYHILETALEEVKSLKNLRTTLEVQFYGEVSPLLNNMCVIICCTVLGNILCYNINIYFRVLQYND